MLLDIVILPPAKLRNKLGTLAQQLGKTYPARYVVDNKKLIPHVSLYHFRTGPSRLRNIEQAVKMVLKTTSVFKLSGKMVEYGRYSIGLKVNKPMALLSLKKAILASCSPLRTGMMPNMFKRKMTKEVKQALKDYGTVGTVLNYHPHITLLANFNGKLHHKKWIKISYPIDFYADNVAIAEVNNWYQVTRIIKRFKV